MSCFGNKVSPDLYQNCCNANTLCEFSGNIEDVVTEPLYVQKVYDAVLFNLQGMKTVQNQHFTPNIPRGHRVRRVLDIRCKRFFNPSNIDDPENLQLDVNTTISGATFLRNGQGETIEVVGPDGTFSEKILYTDTSECDDKCMGTPIFGTQSIEVSGNVQVYIDLLLADSCNNEVVFTVCADVNIASNSQPLILTNFFEICMPSVFDTAFLPRFTEFCNTACETRLATNNYGRDLTISQNGEVSANLIIAICITCEKKIIVPVQLCVLSTGFAQISPQVNTVCSTFPSLFPNQIKESDTIANCSDVSDEEDDCSCDPCGRRNRNCGCNDNCCDDDCCDGVCNSGFDCNDNNQRRSSRSNRNQYRR
ncbi:hypothetical protein [Aminipila sp.]|uniref:hypothetical protein n=1 Tax=Aminipila sp. TaxID=2060095 RepID=UPI0028A01B1D|nr:hypothetical protein [Aminipila sp.]